MKPNKTLRHFLRSEVGVGSILLVCVVIACIVRSSPAGLSYLQFWKTDSIGGIHLPFSLQKGINDVLMSLFFFVVTLEIKKEFIHGEFKKVRNAAIPTLVAIAGMVGPALVCAAINWGKPSIRAWPIPVATDIALSLGVLAIVSEKLPSAMRPFMATIALVDDIGGIILVALLYTSAFHTLWAIATAVVFVVAWLLFKRFNPHLALAAIVFVALWYGFSKAGINPSLSGVLAAICIPGRSLPNHRTFVELYEQSFKPMVNYLIIPIFLLANAGADLNPKTDMGFDVRIFAGVALGLYIGKFASMYISARACERFGVGKLPAGTTNASLLGFSFIGGVGLKMCVFLVPLALPAIADQSTAILGIYCGLTASAITAILLLYKPWHRARTAA